MSAPYRGVLFDLFGTLITVDPGCLPELEIDGGRVRTTVAGLAAPLAEWLPGAAPAEFWKALMAVSEEMARARTLDHVEHPSRERFRRALVRVGCASEVVAEAAVHLSRAHMATISGATVLPLAHAAVLAAVRARCRVGVVSNFDDTGTAYEILHRHGILSCLDTIVISEAVGLRKPHPAPVCLALRGLGLAAAETLLVGDTFAEDVFAAHAAGVDAAWIDARGQGPPPAAAPPRYVLGALADVVPIVTAT